ncbi:hypothetical protein [Rhodovulum sulfidophilum]|uniref:hypothetical protein n=1 Tax=Rhodovulum sulfidophilum TaxID=35806 RepID=UPI0019221700|nr:hypothetical protein [Rhodovulum sulfidophilum]MBL3559686.1 hypothetical protein [Rhodovulum sulfidophilum]
MLAGRPVDWDFLRQVVLLPNKDWEAGPERIEELRARIELQRRVEELEQQLATVTRDRTGIGGNNPPEPIETEADLRREFLIVWQPLEDLRSETEQAVPDKGRIRSAISALSGVLAEIGKWTGGKLDRAVDKAIDWGVPAVLGYLALHEAKIRQVIDAAEVWLKTL